MKKKIKRIRFFPAAIVLLCAAASVVAGYKARPWSVNARESYPASLTSEGVTIAVNPLFNDALAAQVFDKDDIVTRGIMPVAILIFNDNDYAVEVDGMSLQLLRDEDRIRTLSPGEVVGRLYGKSNPLTGQPASRPSNAKALEDFENKFLLHKPVGPHSKGGGFVYIPVRDVGNLVSYLSAALVYLPNVYRQDNGSRLVFFEINLNAALPSGARGQSGDSRHGPSRP
jgi:hypothetical protein